MKIRLRKDQELVNPEVENTMMVTAQEKRKGKDFWKNRIYRSRRKSSAKSNFRI